MNLKHFGLNLSIATYLHCPRYRVVIQCFILLTSLLDMIVMTDNPNSDLPNPEDDTSSDMVDNASFDLKKAAEEAMKRLEQTTTKKRSKDTASLNPIPEDSEEEGHTTNDLQQEAYHAMKLEAESKRDAELARADSDASATFTEGMRLKLTSAEATSPIIKPVEGELVVGRADNVTDYLPDIDLTPHGAYRLGLSRRHAIILRENDTILVKDLNSRNGTFINGVIVAAGGTQVIHHGDEIRFGNLVMHASFED